MDVQPRQHLLEVWRAFASYSGGGAEWRWGGRDGSNSISDAEQLLCIMSPAADVPTFRIDRPDETEDDVIGSLAALGDHLEVPRRLVQLITEYLEKYTAPDGTPVFAGDTYFTAADPSAVDEIKPEQRGLDVVDSFSISVTLMLATIGFAKTFRAVVTRETLRQQVDRLEQMAGTRLTAAMVGLLRSFAVNVFDTSDEQGRQLLKTTNQSRLPERQVVEQLRLSLREINARLRDDVTIGSGAEEGSLLDNPHRLFECGWSWGLVENAPPIEGKDQIGRQPPAWPSRSRTCISRWSRSTLSGRCSPSAPGCSACSTRSSCASRRRCSCAGISPSRTGPSSRHSARADGRWKIFHGLRPTVSSPTTSAC